MIRKSIITLVLVMAAAYAFADKRHFAWTYEWMTMPKGMAEVEYYLTAESPVLAKANVNTWKHWVELEAGIFDIWDVSMYQLFKQSNRETGSSFQYDGFKLRTRLRVPELAEFMPDFLFYLEYIRDADFTMPHVLEAKVIVAKEILNQFQISYNQVIEYEIAGAISWEYAAGIGYSLSPSFGFGVESKGNFTSTKFYAGPTVSFATPQFWAAISMLVGLNGVSDNLQARIILGVPLMPFTPPAKRTNQ